jgi:hypothetical protein
MKKILTTIFLLLIGTITLLAQENESAKQATGLRADGKIYVVIFVVVTILLGLFLYVIRLDRKISKLEKNENVKM